MELTKTAPDGIVVLIGRKRCWWKWLRRGSSENKNISFEVGLKLAAVFF